MDRILIVEDEEAILMALEDDLCLEGYAVETAADGPLGLSMATKHQYDLIILDVMLPKMDGFEVCRRLRSTGVATPVLMLTAKSQEIDKVLGLELGADDYVTKPFSPRELVLRVRAMLRRAGPERESARVLACEQVRVDTTAHRCFVAGKEVELTSKEFDLLVALMRRPGRVLSRERLLDEVWGSSITVTTRTIDTHLKRLRAKIGAGSDLIETVRGVGYRFVE